MNVSAYLGNKFNTLPKETKDKLTHAVQGMRMNDAPKVMGEVLSRALEDTEGQRDDLLKLGNKTSWAKRVEQYNKDIVAIKNAQLALDRKVQTVSTGRLSGGTPSPTPFPRSTDSRSRRSSDASDGSGKSRRSSGSSRSSDPRLSISSRASASLNPSGVPLGDNIERDVRNCNVMRTNKAGVIDYKATFAKLATLRERSESGGPSLAEIRTPIIDARIEELEGERDRELNAIMKAGQDEMQKVQQLYSRRHSGQTSIFVITESGIHLEADNSVRYHALSYTPTQNPSRARDDYDRILSAVKDNKDKAMELMVGCQGKTADLWNLLS